ncbi:fungal-specific transcription factor domain-containing protein, partial [Gamsiella multidivaricata]|uniref:fungal-specific transcription factor domain-containing protein n=1 Tax=Gamsiella multidivaricata TaxID=101098 RepID=UPI002220B052
MLAETTLSNVAYYGPSAAAVASVFNDEDLWGPQLGAASTEGDVLVPEEMQVLPDLATREYLIALYYKNHYFSLPMVQREVLRVCQENIHIPHCLLLCNAVFYCGSMFSSNTLSLRKDRNDEGTVGEDFFMRGQVLLEKKYLTAHLCTIQALLLFAIGHKSPAQRSAFISQAITMALDMGLHTRLDSSAHPFVRAYRARVFWCCYLFDSTASAINGKPALINDEEISIDMFQAGDLGPDTETFSDQYIIHCLHGWQICRRIRKNSKLIVRQPPPPRSILLDNLARLDNELVEWQENLPKAFDFLPVDGCIISDISSLAACAQLLCYALIILLHHPYLPNPKSKEAFQPSAPGLPDSQGYCTQAAKEITKIAGILLKEAPRTFEQNTPSRYALNFAIRIHLRNSKCLVDPTLAKESRRDLQRTMDYIERVEDLQFFRINRSKKSDMTDLLASCRAALAQQKSSLDLAKEAAALKHRQMLQEKEALKAKQRLLQEQQQQRQQQQQQAH